MFFIFLISEDVYLLFTVVPSFFRAEGRPGGQNIYPGTQQRLHSPLLPEPVKRIKFLVDHSICDHSIRETTTKEQQILLT